MKTPPLLSATIQLKGRTRRDLIRSLRSLIPVLEVHQPDVTSFESGDRLNILLDNHSSIRVGSIPRDVIHYTAPHEPAIRPPGVGEGRMSVIRLSTAHLAPEDLVRLRQACGLKMDTILPGWFSVWIGDPSIFSCFSKAFTTVVHWAAALEANTIWFSGRMEFDQELHDHMRTVKELVQPTPISELARIHGVGYTVRLKGDGIAMAVLYEKGAHGINFPEEYYHPVKHWETAEPEWIRSHIYQ